MPRGWGSLAQERAYDWGVWHPMWDVWGPWGLVMFLMILVFWALVLAGFIVGLRWLTRQARQFRPDAALEILRERYARGEISKDEFEAKKRDLLG